MEGETFDDLVKRLTQARLSRVAAVRGVLASAVVGLTGATRAAETAARKRAKGKGKGKKSKGKRHVQAQAPPKVTLCHHGQTTDVAPSAVAAHLGHGDTLGPCGATSPGPCTPTGRACQQNSDCCGGNCFGQVCATQPSTCPVNGSSQACSPAATGCCAGDGCCQPPNNQCNTTGGQQGLCCAPNCNGRQCGPDGCGNDGTCGSCLPGQTCSANGKCQGKPTCSPANCPGCCDKNGQCQPGNTEQACGTGGAPCVNCPGAQSSCQNGQCQCAPQCQGKECGPDGCGGTCGCGVGGTCTQGTVCPSGQVCTCPGGGVCNPVSGQCPGPPPSCSQQTCRNGCCDADGTCQPGNSDAQCGRGGVPCVQCQPSQVCCSTPSCDQFQGQCVCTFDSCPDGCCEDFTTCRPGTTNEFCGLGGLECLTCDPDPPPQGKGQVCAEIGSGPDTERNCICTPQTCPDGCCDGGPGNPGSCFENQAGACGIGGALCQSCINFQICTAQGQCVCSPRSCPRCQTCNAGTGQCQPLVCPPPADQCHVTGTCNPATGQCSTPTVAHGTPCSDGNPLCINGQCCTAGHEVVNGGCFQASTSSDCPECDITRFCQCFGSVEGSPFFLCGERNNTCSSTADCPPGQACAGQFICINPC